MYVRIDKYLRRFNIEIHFFCDRKAETFPIVGCMNLIQPRFPRQEDNNIEMVNID